MELMAAVTGDDRFEKCLESNDKKGRKHMRLDCAIMNRAEEHGIAIGMERGMERGKMTILHALITEGLITLAEGARRVNLTEAEFLERCKELEKPEGELV